MSSPESASQGVNCRIGYSRIWKDKRGKHLCRCPPLFDDPLSKFGLFEDLYAGNGNDQADDGKDQQILPDDPVGQGGAIENQQQ